MPNVIDKMDEFLFSSEEDMVISRNFGLLMQDNVNKSQQLNENESFANLTQANFTNTKNDGSLKPSRATFSSNLNKADLKQQQQEKKRRSMFTDKLIIKAKLLILEILEVYTKNKFSKALFPFLIKNLQFLNKFIE